MGLVISRISADSVPTVWPEVSPLLRKATNRSGGRYDVDDLLQPLESGLTELWTIRDGEKLVLAFVTAIQRFPKCSVLTIPVVGGFAMTKWLRPGLEAMEAYARETGCTRLEGGGRRGWERALAGSGWVVTRITIEKEIKVNGSHRHEFDNYN